ncbi:TetR/AcrR family transcriptional regulator [Paenibacillus nasutitermitis]|uniref:TetR family transcriptional regulator n=1 Tax=Paenibacillus nasutitermitis TaxID=1652958 RepID=A0A917DRW0_9BACL|nr:TetR/AcrR family transcriptional regulator [Paenibacillus nasutitermitis]GGD60785.1 TetR family transcriptional regulator [Paenibacillus nasutitermitis]
MNSDHTNTSTKSLRADAQRNRVRILDAAFSVFAAEGLSVPIEEIARQASVGIGTVYRNFPTKELLFEAVIHRYQQKLVEEAESLLNHDDPGEAFFRYISRVIEGGAANKALTVALSSTEIDMSAIASGISDNLKGVMGKLLTRAQQSGAVRKDISADHVKALMVGSLLAIEQMTGEAGFSAGITAVICDGLRTQRSL